MQNVVFKITYVWKVDSAGKIYLRQKHWGPDADYVLTMPNSLQVTAENQVLFWPVFISMTNNKFFSMMGAVQIHISSLWMTP